MPGIYSLGHRHAVYRIAADSMFSAFACRCREGEVFLARLRGPVAYKSRDEKDEYHDNNS